MDTGNKYYTPKIEEFHIGFEYEIYNYEIKKHQKYTVTPEDFYYPVPINQIRDKKCRVKYLDREDIESFGFKYRGNNGIEDIYQTYTDIYGDGDYEFFDEDYIYINKYNQIKITHKSRTLFWGEIKNKSEFKKLLIQLGIVKDEK